MSSWLLLTLLASTAAQRYLGSEPPPQDRDRDGDAPGPKKGGFDFGLTDYGPTSSDFGPSYSLGRPQQQDPFSTGGLGRPRPGPYGYQPGSDRYQPGPDRYQPGGAGINQPGFGLGGGSGQLDFRPLSGQSGQESPGYGLSPAGFGGPIPREQRGFGGVPNLLGERSGGGPGGFPYPQQQQPDPRGSEGGDGFFSGGKGPGSSLFPSVGVLSGVRGLGSGGNARDSGHPGGQGGSGLFGGGGEGDVIRSLAPSGGQFAQLLNRNPPPSQDQEEPEGQTGQRENGPLPQNPYSANPNGAAQDNRQPYGGQLGPYGSSSPDSSGNPSSSQYENQGPRDFPSRGSGPGSNVNPYQSPDRGQNQEQGQPSDSKGNSPFSFPQNRNPFGKDLFGGNLGQDLFKSPGNLGQGKPQEGGSQQPQGYFQQSPPQDYNNRYPGQNDQGGPPPYDRPQSNQRPLYSQDQSYPTSRANPPQNNPDQLYPSSPAGYQPQPAQSNPNPYSTGQGDSSPLDGFPRQNPSQPPGNPYSQAPPQQGYPGQYPPQSQNQYPPSNSQSPGQYSPPSQQSGNPYAQAPPQQEYPGQYPPQSQNQYPPSNSQGPGQYPPPSQPSGNPYAQAPSQQEYPGQYPPQSQNQYPPSNSQSPGQYPPPSQPSGNPYAQAPPQQGYAGQYPPQSQNQYPPSNSQSPGQYPPPYQQPPSQYSPPSPIPQNQYQPAQPQPSNQYQNQPPGRYEPPQPTNSYQPPQPQTPNPYQSPQSQPPNTYQSPGYTQPSNPNPYPPVRPQASEAQYQQASRPEASQPSGSQSQQEGLSGNSAYVPSPQASAGPSEGESRNVGSAGSQGDSGATRKFGDKSGSPYLTENNNNAPPVSVSFGPARSDNSNNDDSPPPSIHSVPADPNVKPPTPVVTSTPAPTTSAPSTTDKIESLKTTPPTKDEFGLNTLFSFASREGFPALPDFPGQTNSTSAGLIGSNNRFPFSKRLGQDFSSLFKLR